MRLICPVMSSGFNLAPCHGDRCAWFDCVTQSCGVVRPEARFWLTPKGRAEVERIHAECGGEVQVGKRSD